MFDNHKKIHNTTDVDRKDSNPYKRIGVRIYNKNKKRQKNREFAYTEYILCAFANKNVNTKEYKMQAVEKIYIEIQEMSPEMKITKGHFWFQGKEYEIVEGKIKEK